MKIEFVEIQNFRRLKSCRVEFSKQETVLVGANNSGKTSAMDALILFLSKPRRKEIRTTDFTLSNWLKLEDIASEWEDPDITLNTEAEISRWRKLVPTVDVWLSIDEDDLQHVGHILPTLEWQGEHVGVRLILEPKNLEELYSGFLAERQKVRALLESTTEDEATAEGTPELKLWPRTMRDYLERELQTSFAVSSYVLDPTKVLDPTNGVATTQDIEETNLTLDREPFDGLFKVDIIRAQRGFSDANTNEDDAKPLSSLSSQFRRYFTRHLNPSESPTKDDVNALRAIEAAREAFDGNLRTSFSPAISELQTLNYPGFTDPEISVTSQLNPIDGLNHEAAVQFTVLPDDDASVALHVPERYNGLGYQNLISIIFNLIRFRDEWLRIGKAALDSKSEHDALEPLHLVLLEEPEAHLHAQVQQVFVKKAYNVLRGREELEENQNLSTQLVISTHSSHIAHEIEFTSLRYFRRQAPVENEPVPTSTVVNLTKVFGSADKTSRFATRYLRATHCDLFFADAAILIEGAAERMLVPHFIRENYLDLHKAYISLLEIGGSHAFRLRDLVEELGLPTLIITDLDCIGSDNPRKQPPIRGQGLRTSNSTLKTWLPEEESIDSLLDLPPDSKTSSDGLHRVAYQFEVSSTFNADDGEGEQVIPSTFEDSLVWANSELFGATTHESKLLEKLSKCLELESLDECRTAMLAALKNGDKAEMALEVLFAFDVGAVKPPTYIADGLDWLNGLLGSRVPGIIVEEVFSGEAQT